MGQRRQDATRLLIRSGELIADEEALVKDAYSLDEKGEFASVVSERACRFCLNGALIRASYEVCSRRIFKKGLIAMSGSESVRAFRAYETAVEIVSDLLGFNYEEAKKSVKCSMNKGKERERTIERWNDRQERTHSDVTGLINKAVERIQV